MQIRGIKLQITSVVVVAVLSTALVLTATTSLIVSASLRSSRSARRSLVLASTGSIALESSSLTGLA